ncbi:MAG TPA: hypothetical protein VF815_32490 [Myxococcaceae bacterium]|jgi:hypothetical protein
MEPVPNKQPKKPTSPWLYIAIGCGSLLLIGGLIVGAIVFLVVKKVDEVKDDMANPIARTEKVKKALGAQTLPDGYYAFMTLNIPLVMDTAMLTTDDPSTPGSDKAKDRLFMYIRLKSAPSSDVDEFRDYLEGRTDDPSVLERSNLDIRTDEIVGRGAVQLDGERRLLYLAQRGVLRTNNSTSKSDGPGLNALVLFECPTRSDVRMGIWTAPDTSPGVPLAQLELKGTPVDPDAIRSFMSHFNPCQVN